jgi:hypothetical protein
MDLAFPLPRGPAASLPAQRIDPDGRAHVDFRAVVALALPLMANSAMQIVLNLTDMWFVGHHCCPNWPESGEVTAVFPA